MEELSLEQRIWQVVSTIPPGRVASYGQIARHAGCPNHARFVGATLKKLPSTTSLPWHRVVTSQRKIAFPMDSDKYNTQLDRLKQEHIVLKNNKINSEFMFWQSN